MDGLCLKRQQEFIILTLMIPVEQPVFKHINNQAEDP